MSFMPGKFETSGALGALFYAIAAEGFADEEAGDMDFGRWYARFDGPFDKTLARNFPAEYKLLDADDREELHNAVGVIITEDTQGFIDIETYTSKKKLDKVWGEIEADVSEFYEADEADAEAG